MSQNQAPNQPPNPNQTDRNQAGSLRPKRKKRPLARRSFLIGGTASLLAAGGTSAWALNRYIFDDVQVADTAAFEQQSGATSQAIDTSNVVSTETSWSADGTSIEVRTVEQGSGSDKVTYYVAEVTLASANQLRTGFAQGKFGQNIIEDTSVIAENNNAVFAVNGDYYGFRDTGIQIRNGTIYRDQGARQGLAFYKDGHAEIYDETQTSAQRLLADGVWNTLSFGPAIVENGAVIDGIDQVEVDTNFGNHSIQGEQPRTGIGYIDTNTLVFVVVDGRETGYSRGVTLPEFGRIMTGLGAQIAYNLDGGGSSTFFFQGKVWNRPSNGGERGVSDILYVGT